MPLTDIAVRNAKPKDKPYKLADGKGMHLLIHSNGGKYWHLRYAYTGKERILALGIYPDVSLADARNKAIAAKQLLKEGKDPNQEKRTAKREAILNTETTFKVVAEAWKKANSPRWSESYTDDTWSRLTTHVFPYIGSRPIKSIKPADIMELVRRIEAKGHTDMSHRVLNICGAVFRYAVASGLAEYDPSPSLRGALVAHKKKHFPTLRARELATFLRVLTEVETSVINKLAIRLLMLTFVRQGELRKAKWEDISFKAKEWRIPAHNTKMREEHCVPLSQQALEVLLELRAITGSNPHGLLFPSQNRQKNTMMCENTINNVLKKMGYKGRLVGHGFRALASTTLNEQGFRGDVIERQLAHKERNKVRESYNHAEYLSERTAMMQHWADFIDSQATEGGEVITAPFGIAA